MKRTHFFIPEPAFEHLRELSNKLDITVAELVRRAIDDFLKKQK